MKREKNTPPRCIANTNQKSIGCLGRSHKSCNMQEDRSFPSRRRLETTSCTCRDGRNGCHRHRQSVDVALLEITTAPKSGKHCGRSFLHLSSSESVGRADGPLRASLAALGRATKGLILVARLTMITGPHIYEHNVSTGEGIPCI